MSFNYALLHLQGVMTPSGTPTMHPLLGWWALGSKAK